MSAFANLPKEFSSLRHASVNKATNSYRRRSNASIRLIFQMATPNVMDYTLKVQGLGLNLPVIRLCKVVKQVAEAVLPEKAQALSGAIIHLMNNPDELQRP